MHKPTPTIPDLPDDVVLSVRNVSKKFCRNLRRPVRRSLGEGGSMLYGMQDLARNLLGLRPTRALCDAERALCLVRRAKQNVPCAKCLVLRCGLNHEQCSKHCDRALSVSLLDGLLKAWAKQ